jgi:hypothetical protein
MTERQQRYDKRLQGRERKKDFVNDGDKDRLLEKI